MKFILVIIALLAVLPLQQLWYQWAPVTQPPGGRPRSTQASISHLMRATQQPGFSIGYSEWLRNPLWVSWRVHDEPLQPLGSRPRNFRCAANSIWPVCPDDYRGSGYDRGHLAPNYAMSRLYGRPAQVASFDMSNISPQRRGLNGRLWQRLEELEMDRVRQRRGDFWVIAGPVFSASPKRLPSAVAIPEAFYRIWFEQQVEGPRALAFLVPQGVEGREDLRDFLTTVDAVEARTGLDFFPAIAAPVQARFESTRQPEGWGMEQYWRTEPRY